MSKKRTQRKPKNQALWWVAGAAVVVVGALVAINTFGAKKEATLASGAKTDAAVHAVRNVKGASSAKVKLVEYSDFL